MWLMWALDPLMVIADCGLGSIRRKGDAGPSSMSWAKSNMPISGGAFSRPGGALSPRRFPGRPSDSAPPGSIERLDSIERLESRGQTGSGLFRITSVPGPEGRPARLDLLLLNYCRHSFVAPTCNFLFLKTLRSRTVTNFGQNIG